MIKVNKRSDQRPSIIHSRGVNKGKDKLLVVTQELKDYFETNKKNINLGIAKFNFKSDLYAHESIKKSLKELQHDKCCFCEAKLSHTSYGDIEHFRPKAAYCQDNNDSLTFPGYFWLAYDWDNLFFSCQKCNQRYKKNHFPILNNTKRVTDYNDDTNKEFTVFLDLSKDKPEEHITFIDEVPREVPGSYRGKMTIEALGLDRAKLNEDRKKVLSMFIDLLIVIKFYPDVPEMKVHHDKAKEYINSRIFDLMKPESEYSLMFKCFYELQVKTYL